MRQQWRGQRAFLACGILIMALAGPLSACGSATGAAPSGKTSTPGVTPTATPRVTPTPVIAATTAPTTSSTPATAQWQVVTSPNVPATLDDLHGVAAVSANDVWAVGGASNFPSSQTLIERWNGSSWSIVPSPNDGSSGNSLYAIAAVAANDVWAVGAFGYVAAGDHFQPLIEHWDGSSWSIIPGASTCGDHLFGVAAASTNDVWAVGTCNYDIGSHTPLIEHWDGTNWTAVSSPNLPSASGNALYGVTAVSTGDVWAVGSSQSTGPEQPLIEHWNGTGWSIVSSPSIGTNGGSLDAVAALSANDVWAVGESRSTGIQQPLIERWDGSSWSVVSTPNLGSYGGTLGAVAAASANDAWTVGTYLDAGGGPAQPLIERWDGTSWQVVSSPTVGSSGNGLNAVAASSSAGVWAVGHITTTGGQQTLIERYG
jgi:hypothetical protein